MNRLVKKGFASGFIFILLGVSLLQSITSGASAIIEHQGNNLIDATDDIEKELNLVYGSHIFSVYALEDVETFNLLHVVPLIYDEQAPVFINIGNKTTADIISYKIENHTYQPNKIVNLTIGRLNKGEEIIIHLEYWVLIKYYTYENLPELVEMPNECDLPEDVKIFLQETNSAQSNKFLIKLKAKKLLRKSDGNLLTYADKIVTYTHRNRVLRSLSDLELKFQSLSVVIPTILTRIFPKGLAHIKKLNFELGNMNLIISEPMMNDALSAYYLGGICTGVSNLGAALFRANGVPAKQLIVNCEKKSKNKTAIIHYINNFYCPGYGWVIADSRYDFAGTRRDNKEYIVLRAIYPEDENEAGSGLKANGGLVPWMWMNNYNIIRGNVQERCWNEGKINASANVASDTINLTRNVWKLQTKYDGKELDGNNEQHFTNAIAAQQSAIECFINSDLNGYIDNIAIAYKEYNEIDYP